MRKILLVAIIFALSHTSESEAQSPPLPVQQFQTADQRRAVSDYLVEIDAYRKARKAYEREAGNYWDAIASKRSQRRKKRARGSKIVLNDYVLDQPPVYSGPNRPELPSFIPRASELGRLQKRTTLPVVRDFLLHAKQQFRFVPERPRNELDYKRAYARAALAAGIRPDQAIRIYGFEASGNGTHDVQAGLESKKKRRQPISTALGYNQLLIANTIGLVSKYGRNFAAELEIRAKAAAGPRLEGLQYKIDRLKRMIRYAQSMPYRWSTHVRASKRTKAQALHALILDVDIGPLLQTQKLLNSIKYARRLGYNKPLTAAELEMLNLTGDGNGFDMISMPQSMRKKVPTANFFQRRGYERNPVASRNNVVSALIAATDRKMDYHAALDGAKEMASAFEDVSRELGINWKNSSHRETQ